MFSALPDHVQRELAALAGRFGAPIACTVDLPIGRHWSPRFGALGALADTAADVLAAHPGADPALDPREWWDWGRLRALAHRAVHEALTRTIAP
jgi:hypothetical protein